MSKTDHSVGDVNLNPGRIGLGVLDGITFEVPVVTIVNPHHSPEVVYLENRRNGLVAKDDGLVKSHLAS